MNSFGLNITENIPETDKSDWVNYNGTYVSKRTAAALKARDTRKVNKEKNSYNNKLKRKQRKKLIQLFNVVTNNYNKYNPSRYASHPSIILLESPEVLFLEELRKNKDKIDEKIFFIRVYIPNEKEYDELDKIIYESNDNYNYRYKDLDYRIDVLRESYNEFIKVCKDGRQARSRCFRHGTWIQNIYPERFEICFIWADYCGAFSKHMEDIELTFKSKLLCNHSIYALTFNTRDPSKKKTKYSSMNTIIAVQDYIKKTSKKYGYIVEFLTDQSGLYKPHMYTAVFKCIYEPIEKNLDKIIEFVKTYHTLHSELLNRLHQIDKEIDKDIRERY